MHDLQTLVPDYQPIQTQLENLGPFGKFDRYEP